MSEKVKDILVSIVSGKFSNGELIRVFDVNPYASSGRDSDNYFMYHVRVADSDSLGIAEELLPKMEELGYAASACAGGLAFLSMEDDHLVYIGPSDGFRSRSNSLHALSALLSIKASYCHSLFEQGKISEPELNSLIKSATREAGFVVSELMSVLE